MRGLFKSLQKLSRLFQKIESRIPANKMTSTLFVLATCGHAALRKGGISKNHRKVICIKSSSDGLAGSKEKITLI